MNHCPFCFELKSGDRVVKKSKNAFVLLSNPRLLKGHCLVVPSRHVEYPGELTDEEIVEVFGLIEETRKKILTSKLGTGVDIRQNFRPFLSQSRLKVNHVHFHVLPREDEDDLYKKSMRYERELFSDLTDEEMEDVLERLR